MHPAKLSSILILTLGFLFSLTVRAQTPDTESLSFKSWKEQQILSAQNHLLRLSADLESQKKLTEPTPKNEKVSSKERALERFRTKSARSKVEKLESEVKQAQETVKVAMGLSLEDYTSIYLPSVTGGAEVLEKLLEQMSKEEISKIMAELLKRQSDQRDSLTRGSSRVGHVLSSASGS